VVVAPHPGSDTRPDGVGSYSPSWNEPSSWCELRTTRKLGVFEELRDALDAEVDVDEVEGVVVELSADEVWDEVA
jgi:hypothetical protein